jgi:hypothetical protein
MPGRRPLLAALVVLPLGLGCPVEVPDPGPGFGSGSEGASGASTGTGTTTGSTGPSAEASTADGSDSPDPQVCGNGVIEGSEQCDCGGTPCDLEGLGGRVCSDVDDPDAPGPLTGGVLDCDPLRCTYVTTQCSYCGDGMLGGVEDCEPPSVPLPQTCAELDAGAAGDAICNAECRFDTSGCTDCGVRFEFDRCPEGWVALQLNPGAAPPSWECGLAAPGVGPGPYPSNVWGTDLDAPYGDDESSGLRSPPITLRGCVHEALEIRVRHFMSFETAGPVVTDGGNLQVSDDPLTGWTTVAPVSGTLYDAAPLQTSFPPPDGEVGWNGQNPDEDAWTESRFRLEGFGRFDPLYLRFQFGSDGSGTDDGWYIDRVELLEVP